MPTPDELTEGLVVALSYAEPSRWQIGQLMIALRDVAGTEAMYQAVPEGAERLARTCLAVVERWPDGPADGLEFGHYRRVRHYDDAAASVALAEAAAKGWTPAQMGRWLAGLDPNEPAVAEMARRLAAGTDGVLRLMPQYTGEWAVVGSWAAPQPSIGAAIRAAWRAQFGAKGKGEGE